MTSIRERAGQHLFFINKLKQEGMEGLTLTFVLINTKRPVTRLNLEMLAVNFNSILSSYRTGLHSQTLNPIARALEQCTEQHHQQAYRIIAQIALSEVLSTHHNSFKEGEAEEDDIRFYLSWSPPPPSLPILSGGPTVYADINS